MSDVMRYVKLWWRCVVLAILEVAEYRANFVLSIFTETLGLWLVVLTFGLMYQFTSEIAGWTREQVLVLAGIFWTFNGIWDMQIQPNLGRVSDYVESGEMDFFLLRPVDGQFLVSVRRFSPWEGTTVLLGLGLVLWAGSRADVRWSLVGVLAAVALLLCGLLLLYALRFVVVTCAFWLVNVGSLYNLFHPAFAAAQYPVTFFGGWLRVVLTVVVPVAFATTFPAQALMGELDGRLVASGMGGAAVALWASHRFWRFAVRHYASASS